MEGKRDYKDRDRYFAELRGAIDTYWILFFKHVEAASLQDRSGLRNQHMTKTKITFKSVDAVCGHRVYSWYISAKNFLA